jgi:FkbM family methyltransferase
VAADVGAARGLAGHWRTFEGLVRFYAFEPHPESFRAVRDIFARKEHSELYTVFPTGLAATDGERTLYVTNLPTGSSLLKLNLDSVARAYGSPSHAFPCKEITIETRRLESVLAELGAPPVDMIKLDVQGAELEVLEGMGSGLDRLLLIECEMNVLEAHEGQPTFADYDIFFRDHGMELFDARPERGHLHRDGRLAGYHGEVFNVYPNCPAISARVWHFDGVYFRSVSKLIAEGEPGRVRKQIVAFCGYNFFTEAHRLAEEACTAGLFEPEDAKELQRLVVSWFRTARFRPYHGVGRLGRFLRAVMKRRGMGKDQRRWAQYKWVDYPHG